VKRSNDKAGLRERRRGVHVRLLGAIIVAATVSGVASVAGVGIASASQLPKLCTGYSACNQAPYTNNGYNTITNKKSYWGADPGDNCTNYVAYVEGTDYGATYPGTGLGNAEAWGTDKLPVGSIVNDTPSVGAVAWWNSTAGLGSAGHVAIVESYTATSVTVSEDAYVAPGYSDGRDFDWRTYTTSGAPSYYPTGFIHFAGAKVPTSPPPGEWNRYYNSSSRTHADVTGTPPAGFNYEETLGDLLLVSEPGTTLLYSCQSGVGEFTSPNSNCEGQHVNGAIGYIYNAPPTGLVTRAVYRCRTASGDHFDSPLSNCEGQIVEFRLGYVLAYT